jgi:N-acetylglucosaminyl-diphospho-decaprenol L-rhamnosyltransferase
MPRALSASAAAPSPLTVPSVLRPANKLCAAQRPRLSVVLVNYHHWQETSRLVGQLLAAPGREHDEAEVVVVDNHSPADPLTAALRRWPGVSLRRWRRNRGFARAANEGCRLSRGRWLLLLNPDMSVSDGFLREVLTLTETLPEDAGIVGFGLQHQDGSDQLSAGRFPTLLSTLAGLTRPRSRRKYLDVGSDRPAAVDWVTGCCLLVRRECFDQLGGFDRNFFLYYEDVDLCRRARARGWSVWYEPRIRLVHHWPLHTRPVPAALRLFTRHALLTYAARHWPDWQFQALAALVAGDAWFRQAWADWCREAEGVRVFRELRALAGELAAGRVRSARRRLERVVSQEEKRRASRPVDRDSEPPPGRPAASLLEKCYPARAAERGSPRDR